MEKGPASSGAGLADARHARCYSSQRPQLASVSVLISALRAKGFLIGKPLKSKALKPRSNESKQRETKQSLKAKQALLIQSLYRILGPSFIWS